MIAAQHAKEGLDIGVALFFAAVIGVWMVYRLVVLEIRRWHDQHLRMSREWTQAYRRHPSGRGV